MTRVRFEKGKQREFMKQVLEISGCPSLRELINRGVDANYQTLKNYYAERRLLTDSLFDELLRIANLDKGNFIFEIVNENWGKVKGGKISKRNHLLG